MGGGLMQLVAYGAQDIYLTGNPQITFFKVVYRRHTNFSMESIEQTFNGSADFGKRVSCTISRNGDLVSRMYLSVGLPAQAADTGAWVNWPGHKLIKSVEVEIGGQRIDKHYGDWMHIWNELTVSSGHAAGYATMVGNTKSLMAIKATAKGVAQLHIPLDFWFCKNPGLALPLIALQYHEVKVNLELATLAEMSRENTCTGSLNQPSLYVDYIYLDTDERRRFAQVSHEYLIEQLQYTGEETVPANTSNTSVSLNFNHPCKELVWVVQDSTWALTQPFNYTTVELSTANAAKGGNMLGDVGLNSLTNPVDLAANAKNHVATAKLQLNGHDRFSVRDGSYFNYVQPYQHHTNIPTVGVNVYSFGLKPEEHQPSGTCNMSRIDNANLALTLQTSARARSIRVYATNYNVLRIMSGMGGLAYSN